MDVEILDRCLQRIQTHESSLEECLREYPDQAEQLRPLLIAAAQAHGKLAPAGPSQAFRDRAWKRLVNTSGAAAAPRQSKAPRRRWSSWKPAYTLASLLLAIGLLAGSVGAAYASGEALPGDSLYGVKRGLERAALALTATDAGDAQLLLTFADRRLGEAEELLRRGRPADLAQALAGYETAIAELLEVAAQEPDELDAVADALATHERKLQEVLDQAPEQAQPGLNRALESSHHGMEAVEKIRSENDPGDSSPGKLKKTPSATSRIPPGQLKKTPTPEG
jgi:hypothetical protein